MRFLVRLYSHNVAPPGLTETRKLSQLVTPYLAEKAGAYKAFEITTAELLDLKTTVVIRTAVSVHVVPRSGG
jgi:hypothetical protein